MSNKDAPQIKKIVDSFKTNDQLSYDQYLHLANAEDSLGSYHAYNTFKDKGKKLTADDIKNFIPNLKKSSSEVNYGASASDQDDINDAKITKYCADHPKDPSCACINTATKLVQNAKSEQAAYDKKYAAWLDLNKHNEAALAKYNADLAAYIKTLQDWSDVQIKSYRDDTPNYDSTKDYIMREYYDGWGWSYRNKWTIKHTPAYINQLAGVWKITNTLPNTPPQPNYSPPSLTVPCCNNTITGNIQSISDVIQSCQQQIINNKDMNKPDDKKSGDKKSGDKKSGDKKSGDKKSGDKKSGDKKSGDDNSDDQTTTSKNRLLWIIGIASIVIIFLLLIGVLIYFATRKGNADENAAVNVDGNAPGNVEMKDRVKL